MILDQLRSRYQVCTAACDMMIVDVNFLRERLHRLVRTLCMKLLVCLRLDSGVKAGIIIPESRNRARQQKHRQYAAAPALSSPLS